MRFAGPPPSAEPAAAHLNLFLGALRNNGQICGSEWPMAMEDGCCFATVLAPAADSLDERYHGSHVRQRLADAQQAGITFAWSLIGPACDSADACACANPSAYVLFTTFLTLESPVRCMDCFGPVPLYRFTAPPDADFHDVISWQSDYQSCDHLQMNCTVLERAATRQMSTIDSALSAAGCACCAALSERAGKPFYYYLYRAKGRSAAREAQRRCPACDGPWQLCTYSIYSRQGQLQRDAAFHSTPEEDAQLEAFMARLLADPAVDLPAASVVDVGIIDGLGWACVEQNAAWGAGIYGCDAERVLAVLARASVKR
ncbi:DUF2310 family Zn-ribbon-containing protein [Massilia antarctica]|uniref:DUF2310 family Zn-ribbon-containing protein n=1 Tax=Massilia antarctica TaxID=2765360 RepID=UPI0006BB6E58|nr:DUF2310 family Zn-ribbon-containing protein [Massilia sp. H27-R4]MCY0910135.1 DUF2310 family Zn-ribbon-containing protein [Massilia sp. H27-R4]CUI02772.1 Zn-ribbon-containing, possibly nucleic-acid-binding protein [Janthinobacterium sp. CG23_2]CUU26558.1 Zn-ribbon-containing, possibly nucleic-acid-binding protein [Janthinobacterium sp. CG23_2]